VSTGEARLQDCMGRPPTHQEVTGIHHGKCLTQSFCGACSLATSTGVPRPGLCQRPGPPTGPHSCSPAHSLPAKSTSCSLTCTCLLQPVAFRGTSRGGEARRRAPCLLPTPEGSWRRAGLHPYSRSEKWGESQEGLLTLTSVLKDEPHPFSAER
jgi:hypothetical protein